MAATDKEFDLEKIFELFKVCRDQDGNLYMDSYVDAYEELIKLFGFFGSVFGFVTSDVVEKIGILRDYRKSEEASYYSTIQGMLEYEVEKNLTQNKKKASGSRTLLRLHRALEFILEFMRKIQDLENGTKLSGVGHEAYNSTLSKHHPWLIRKAVGVALYALPTRKHLIQKMKLEDEEKAKTLLGATVDEGQIIYEISQELYSKYDLLQLP